jgi:alpha-beta hydrolase superfamily lysophospholipase
MDVRAALLSFAVLFGGCVSWPRVTTPPVTPPPGATFLAAPGAEPTRLFVQVDEPAGPARGVVWFVLGPETPAAPPDPSLSAALREAGFATAVLHARGTGFSDGLRGDLDDYQRFLGDFHFFRAHLAARYARVFLLGQSVGGALALEVAAQAEPPVAGVVLVNPAWKLRTSEGMTPSFGDYVRFALDFVFRSAALTVDMNSRPHAIAFGPDREEALAMQRDPLVVRYFSMRYLAAQGALMARCCDNAARTVSPLLVVQGAQDALIEPGSLDALLERAPARDKQKLVVAEGGHGSSAVELAVDELVAWFLAHSP